MAESQKRWKFHRTFEACCRIRSSHGGPPFVCAAKFKTTYFSPKVQNEFIHLLASTVKEKLAYDIQRAKYYGIMFDPTSDAAHQEQMSEIIRYVDINFEKKDCSCKEVFFRIHSSS